MPLMNKPSGPVQSTTKVANSGSSTDTSIRKSRISWHPLAETHSGNTALSVQVEDPDTDLTPFHGAINVQLRRVVEGLCRIFLTRDDTNKKKFIVTNEIGDQLFNLEESASDVPKTINYKLTNSDGQELVTFMGSAPGILGLNGEMNAYYPPEDNQKKRVQIGTVHQKTKCCSLTPRTLIYGRKGHRVFELVDLNTKSIFSPSRRFQPIVFEMRPYEGIPVPFGRIDERMRPTLLVEAKYSELGNHQKSPTVVGQPNPIITSSRLSRLSTASSAKFDPSSMNLAPAVKRSSDLTVGIESIPAKKKSHDNFCIAFKRSLDYQMKILMIGALLYVNDDFIRKDKKYTRACCSMTTITIFLVILILLLLLLTGLLLGFHFGLNMF